MPNASANDPARDGSWHDPGRSVTAIPSFLSWSQTVTEPGHGRVRLAADRCGDTVASGLPVLSPNG